MGRKTNKDLIKKRIANSMSVGDLMKILAELPESMLVGKKGHFGEFLAMSKHDTYKAVAYITPDGYWGNDYKENIDVLVLNTQELGPDPD